MCALKLNLELDIEYGDLSNSAIGASMYQSSADPTNLASIMRNALITWIEPNAMLNEPRIAGLHPGTIWTSEDFDEPLPDEFWVNEV
jgi:hypothetical protein